MTAEEVALVRISFAGVTPRADEIARGFYYRLFAAEPPLRQLFADDMAEQRGKLMLTLATVVQELDRLEALTPAIQAMAVRHVRYGVEERHYALAGAALLGALEAIVPGFERPHVDAWASAYGVLSGAMIQAAYH